MAKAIGKDMTSVDELLVRLFRPPRVLVVLDKPDSVEAMLRRNYDCEVDTARNGREASNLLSSRKYDLVLVDFVLLNGTSQAVLKVAQEHCPDVPVVATKVSEACFDDVMKSAMPVTLLNEPVTFNAIQHLFRVFKIKARTHEIAEYCVDLSRQHSAAATGLAG